MLTTVPVIDIAPFAPGGGSLTTMSPPASTSARVTPFFLRAACAQSFA